MLALGLAACGGDDDAAAPPEPQPTEPAPAPPEPAPAPAPAEPPAPAPTPVEPTPQPLPEPPPPAEPTVGVADTEVPTPSSVPAGAFAVVGDVPLDMSSFDALLGQRETAVLAGGGEFPAAGTPEYETLKNQAVRFLVQREQFGQEAEALGLSATDDELAERLTSLKEQFFGGDEEQYQQELEAQGLTEEQILGDLELQALQEKLFGEITEGVSVSDDEVEAYYAENQESFSTPESRQVAHILLENKADADGLYAQLQDGADFGELARDNSLDTGTAEVGGEYTAVRGQSVPEFDEVAYALETGDTSEPVETQFGWHIINALEDIVPASVQPLDEVRAQIEGLVRRDKETASTESWANALEAKYEDKVLYAPGFEPPDTAPVEDEPELESP